MSHPEGSSLLDFLDAPVIVGDPDSRVIYVNPSFERRLGVSGAVARGETLSSLFEGGSREAVLKAVAEVCGHGQTSHFKLRESGYDYLAQASPIEAEGDRVGVVILLTDEPTAAPVARGLPADLAESVDETIACLQELAAETSDVRLGDVIERGLMGLGQLQKLAAGQKAEAPSIADKSAGPTLDPVRVVRQVAERLGREFDERGCEFDLLVAQKLPVARGDAEGIEAALVELIRHGLQQASGNSHCTLSARLIGARGRQSLLFSVAHLSEGKDGGQGAVSEPAPRQLRDRIEALGGSLHAIANASLGRVTSFQLPFGA